MFLRVFEQHTIGLAMKNGLRIDPRLWPTSSDGHPNVASKKAQIYSYSLAHFHVSPPSPPSI